MNFLLKNRSVLVLIMLFAIAFVACDRKPAGGSTTGGNSTSGGEGGGKKTVAFAQMENTGPWRIAESESMKSEAAKRADKYSFVYTDAQGTTAKQVSDV